MKSTKNYLLFEHYFFGSLFNITLPTLRRPDQDMLQDLAKLYLAEAQKNSKLQEEEAKVKYFYMLEDIPTTIKFKDNDRGE